MPYRNIVFVKLEKRLLNDYRWYTLSEFDQLFYIKLILLGAETYNKIPKNPAILKTALRLTYDIKLIIDSINKIKENFPKFKENKHFYYFEEFENKTNWRNPREFPGSSQGVAKVVVEKEKEKEKEKEDKLPNNTNVLFTYFCDKYKEHRKADYIPSYARDKKILKDLSGILSVDAIQKCIDKFFITDNDYVVKSAYTLPVFKTVINDLNNSVEKKITYREF